MYLALLFLFSHSVLSKLFVTPELHAAHQASLSFTVFQSLHRLMSIESMMPSNHLITSVATFSSCPQSFSASGSFPVNQLFASGSQSIGASALASVLPMNILGWFHLGLIGLISFLSKGLSSLVYHHSLKTSILWHSAFFMVRFSHLHTTTITSCDSLYLCQQSDTCLKDPRNHLLWFSHYKADISSSQGALLWKQLELSLYSLCLKLCISGIYWRSFTQLL